MSLAEMWQRARTRTGRCHVCDAQLLPTEDHTFCDRCWEVMAGPEREED